jgi:hypothetical protein
VRRLSEGGAELSQGPQPGMCACLHPHDSPGREPTTVLERAAGGRAEHAVRATSASAYRSLSSFTGRTSATIPATIHLTPTMAQAAA